LADTITLLNDGLGTTTPASGSPNVVTLGVPYDIAATPGLLYQFDEWILISGNVTLVYPRGATAHATLNVEGNAVVKATFKYINALTQVRLPVINNLDVGIVECYLYHHDSITGLTYPTGVDFSTIGVIRESIDIEKGITEFDNVELEIVEDYTVYAEGFWHKLINEYPEFDFELMFTIREGEDKTFTFRGKLYRKNIQEPEHYLNSMTGSPTSVERTANLKLASSLTVLENVTMNDLCAEVLLHDESGYIVTPYGETFNVVSLANIFASMIRQAYYEDCDTSLVVNNSTDIQVWNYETSAWVSFLDLHISSDFFLQSGEINGQYINRFSNAFELLKHLCGMFCVVPRYTYGTSAGIFDEAVAENNSHRIILNSRGYSGDVVTMDGGIIPPSIFSADTPRRSRLIKATNNIHDEWSVYYAIDKRGMGIPPINSEFDIIKTVDFYPAADCTVGTPGGYPTPKESLFLKRTDPAGYFNIARLSRYRNYELSGGVGYVERDFDGWLCMVVAEYLYHRLSSTRVQYEREYSSIKATSGGISSQRLLRTTMRHTIDDGVTSRNFYATEVEKDIMKNKASVVWVQES
jgi:hypothetical protein